MKLIFLRSRVLIMICLLLILYGCGLMKKTETRNMQSDALLDISKYTKSTHARENNSKSLHLVFEKDSVQQTYQVQLWPKGKFTFSAANGFEGEAERILISGEMQRNSNHAEMLSRQQQNKEEQQTENQERKTQKKSKKDEKKSISPDFRWVITGILLLIFGGIWLYRRFVF